MVVPVRKALSPGIKVAVIQKQHQRSGKVTEGVVDKILTNAPNHPHGIKVRLTDGIIGRVQYIVNA